MKNIFNVVGNVLNDILFLLHCVHFIILCKYLQTIIKTTIETIYGHLNKLNIETLIVKFVIKFHFL